jgi:hypothetical protein
MPKPSIAYVFGLLHVLSGGASSATISDSGTLLLSAMSDSQEHSSIPIPSHGILSETFPILTNHKTQD